MNSEVLSRTVPLPKYMSQNSMCTQFALRLQFNSELQCQWIIQVLYWLGERNSCCYEWSKNWYNAIYWLRHTIYPTQFGWIFRKDIWRCQAFSIIANHDFLNIPRSVVLNRSFREPWVNHRGSLDAKTHPTPSWPSLVVGHLKRSVVELQRLWCYVMCRGVRTGCCCSKSKPCLFEMTIN